MSTDGWTDKEVVVYLYNGLLFSHTKEWIFITCDNIEDIEGIMLSEISQTEEDKHCMISLICGISRQTKKKQTHRYREQIGSCQR